MLYIFDLTINSTWEEILDACNKLRVSFGTSDSFWSKADTATKEKFLHTLTETGTAKLMNLLDKTVMSNEGINIQEVMVKNTNPLNTEQLSPMKTYLCLIENIPVVIKGRAEIANASKIIDVTNILYDENY